MLKVLAVGSGGREHALVWKLAQGARTKVYAAPGNPGIASIAHCLPIPPTDIAALADAAADLAVDLTIVGPEAPLAAGIADVFASRGLRIFGPSGAAAQIESSKAFAKTLMRKWRIPTADFRIFDTPADAMVFVRRVDRPVVVKADGLAAGKGVVVAGNSAEAEAAILDLMVHRAHGNAGSRIVVEDRLEGAEVSVLALVCGARVWPLIAARDYKRAGDGDTGPNTGGMGAVAPPPLPSGLVDRVTAEILEPTAAAMVREGRPYTGVLYAGVMMTAGGPNVLEFNCRFGDPEAQVILPLLQGPLPEVLLDVVDGRVPSLTWSGGAAVCVVLASGGYPAAYRTGLPIAGLADVPADVVVFHAGTSVHGDRLVTAGGRVLNVVGVGATLAEARDRAYGGAARISFEGMCYRTDIGQGIEATRAAVLASAHGGTK